MVVILILDRRSRRIVAKKNRKVVTCTVALIPIVAPCSPVVALECELELSRWSQSVDFFGDFSWRRVRKCIVRFFIINCQCQNTEKDQTVY
jgi:hypothetical protein